MLPDIQAVAEVAHKHDVPLIVDNTVATPYLIQPLKLGADIVFIPLPNISMEAAMPSAVFLSVVRV